MSDAYFFGQPGKFEGTPVPTSRRGTPTTSTSLRVIEESDLPSSVQTLVRQGRANAIDLVAGSTIYTVVHGLNKSAVVVAIYEATTGIEALPRPEIVVTSDTTVTVAFSAPTVLDYRCIIQ